MPAVPPPNGNWLCHLQRGSEGNEVRLDTPRCPKNRLDSDDSAAVHPALPPGAPLMHAVHMPSLLACRYLKKLLQYSCCCLQHAFHWCSHNAEIPQCSIGNYIHVTLYPYPSELHYCAIYFNTLHFTIIRMIKLSAHMLPLSAMEWSSLLANLYI